MNQTEAIQPVVVAPDANADEMNRLHGESYGTDWVYPKRVCDDGSPCVDCCQSTEPCRRVAPGAALAGIQRLPATHELTGNLRHLATNPEAALAAYGTEWAGWCAASALDALVDRNPFAQAVARTCIALCLSEAAERRRSASTYPGPPEPAFLRGGVWAANQCAEKIAAAFGLDAEDLIGKSAPLPPAPGASNPG